MKKKVFLIILAAVLFLAFFFIPAPRGSYDDGGTREYAALAYKVVDWKRLTADGVYDKTKIYWFPKNFKSIDELWGEEDARKVHSFLATVLELNDSSALVQPAEGEAELRSADQIHFGIADLDKIDVRVGSDVKIYYTGGIMESYPAQIRAVQWELAKDLRHKQYTELWLDKETAESCDNDIFDHIVITEIYADCFFASPAIPMPWTIKLNGTLSEDWCVGDQVICTYKNTYRDKERIEADLITIEPSDWEPEPGVAYKPVIYLYPETKTEVSVKLDLNGRLTCTYPAYQGIWQVTAAPDGTLTDADGKQYNYLYWEGEMDARWDMSEGFCVKGEDTAVFLEQALEELGLNRREANEFIVYWLPLMEQNPYNIISFQTEAYTDDAQLQIDPAPDTLIRVFMTWKATDSFISLPPKELSAPERTGFTVVEWGGTEIK